MTKLQVLPLLVLLACGRTREPAPPAVAAPAPPPAPPPRPAPPPLALETRAHVVKGSIFKVPIKARVPAGWSLQGDNTFVPADDTGYPHLEFEATCDGDCTPDKMAARVAERVKKAPERAATPNHNTGDPKLDAVRLDIQVVAQGELPGGSFVAYRQSRPAGLDAPSYMDTFRASCARTRPGADFFVVADVRAPLTSEKDLWPLVLEACKTWELE